MIEHAKLLGKVGSSHSQEGLGLRSISLGSKKKKLYVIYNNVINLLNLSSSQQVYLKSLVIIEKKHSTFSVYINCLTI
jgi:hypothetical protein